MASRRSVDIETQRLRRPAAVPRWWRWARWPILGFFFAAFAWTIGFFFFAIGLEDGPSDTQTPTDAIVVLTGGAGRLDEGMRLLRADKGRVLLISGVNRQVRRREILALVGDPPDALAERITLGYRAARTRDNARETAAWFNSQGFTSMRLVTSNYHMPRAMLELRDALPNARIIANPVAPRQTRAGRWWRNRTGVTLVFKEYNKYLATFVLLLWE